MLSLNGSKPKPASPARAGYVIIGHVTPDTHKLTLFIDHKINPIVKAGDLVYQWYSRQVKLVVANAHYGFEFHCMDTEVLERIALERDLDITLLQAIQ